jgi:hypothetical protein
VERAFNGDFASIRVKLAIVATTTTTKRNNGGNDREAHINVFLAESNDWVIIIIIINRENRDIMK